MKKGKRLLVLLAVVVAFSVGAYWLNLSAKQQEAAKDAAKESAKTVLLTAPAEDMATLTFTRGKQTIDLSKKDGAWVYTPRDTFALDKAKVDTMAGNLKEVKSVRTVADTSDSAADYGLSAPAVVITTADSKGVTQKLSLGDKNATTGDYYAMVEGKPGVYTVPADLYNAFDVTLMQLLTDEAYPTLTADSVSAVTWSDGKATHALTNLPQGDASAYTSALTWFEKKPDGSMTPVSADAVNTFLTAAAGVAYTSVAADQKDDLAAYGLDSPKLTVTLRYTDQVKQSEAAAAIASEAATATAAPTATAKATATAAPTATAKATATAAPTATAKATATAAPTATATAMATATAAPTATATAKATATAAPTATAAGLSSRLPSANAEDASAVPSEAAPTATPEPTVPVERSLTLWFGNTDADGNVYMTHSKTQRVFLISADTYASLLALTDKDLRLNRPLSLSQSEVTGMTVTMDGVTKTIKATTQQSTSENGKQTAKILYLMDGQPLNTTHVTLFLNNLKVLKAESYTDQPVAQGTEPLLSVTFTQNRTGFETVTAAYYPYDQNFVQAVVNGDATMLVNKRDMDKMRTYFNEMVVDAPTATPTATVAAP